MTRRIILAVITRGFSGLVAEILLLREFLITFSGNEFSIGVILANWLILEAFGAFFLGRTVEKVKNKLEAFTHLTLLFSLSLLISIYLIRVLKGMMGVSIGESIGFFPMFISSFLILLPVSVLHGALFTYSCHIYAMFSDQDTSSAGRVYAFETAGMVIGGCIERIGHAVPLSIIILRLGNRSLNSSKRRLGDAQSKPITNAFFCFFLKNISNLTFLILDTRF